MKVLKIIIAVAITITMALTLIPNTPENPKTEPAPQAPKPAHRVSRFLQQKERNPRAADHCHKDNEVCNNSLEGGRNATCCNNKCMDLWYDNKNCGACKKKCAFTETCCRGECVLLSYDKRHCGACNKRCMPGGYCIYGMCDYA